MTILFPDGYEGRLLTLAQLEAKHAPYMHPKFRRAIFPYLASKGGVLGIGGGFRTTQPSKPGFAEDGKSFHQLQRFASGVYGYCALDLVRIDGPDFNASHDAVSWADTADAPEWGLHTFISGEPWHIQPRNIRGWQAWVNAGRPDPAVVTLPAGEPPPAVAPSKPDFGLYPFNQNKPTLKRGDTGHFVIYAQKVLLWLHVTGRLVTNVGAADGQFGANTDAAVRELQAANGLGVDGYVGPNTWAILDWVALN